MTAPKSLIMTIAALLALLAVSAEAMQRQGGRGREGGRGGGECRSEVMQLCQDTGREGVRQCVEENFSKLSEKCQQQMQQRRQGRDGPVPPQPDSEIAYGNDVRQKIDLYKPPYTADTKAPIVVFIHGGGWSKGDRAMVQQKPKWLMEQGYGFAAIGYRLVPNVTVEQQARDIANAIAALRANAPSFSLDADNIILMGHSSGAHLAALLASDSQYLGPDFAAIKGAILLDGAGYDIPARLRTAEPREEFSYKKAFSDDAARQTALSPISHAAAPNAPNWLMLHVAGRNASRRQAEAMGSALQIAGAAVQIEAVADTDHAALNRALGLGSLSADAAVLAFLKGLQD